MEYEDTWTLFRLQSLQPSRFEELCVALLEKEGHSEVEHWGAAGRERGVDIRSMDSEGKWWITQCKRTTSFPPSQAVPELRKVLDRPPNPPPDFYRLAAPCKISRETTEALEALIKEDGSRLEIKAAWSATTLVGFLRDRYPDLHEEFIGKPGSLPFWNVPRRTDFFTGREDVLEELEKRIESSRSAALTQTIVGLGGIGKTQTAIEYCLRHRARYHAGTFWVDASSPASLQADYAACARGLGLADEQVPDDEAAAAFDRHLQRHSGWLVVLDNADNPDAIRPHLPPNSHGHVLITTRDQAPRLGRGAPIRLDCLPIPQATELLLERTRRSEDSRADAEELAIALNLANTLRALGNSLGARDLHEQCLEVRRRVLGDEHPDTLRSMNNLAFTLRDLGEIEEARSLFSAAARGSRKVLGEDHPETKALVTSFQEFEESHPRDP